MNCKNRALADVPAADSAADLPDSSYSKRLASAAIVLIWLVVSYRLTIS
jgi:hypothetical protein